MLHRSKMLVALIITQNFCAVGAKLNPRFMIYMPYLSIPRDALHLTMHINFFVIFLPT